MFEKGLLRVANIITDKVTTKELCVGSVCVTEAEFIKVFGSGANSQITESTPTPSPSESSTPEPPQSDEDVTAGQATPELTP